ncbi:MAG TPA: DUF4870 domain-containing protein [Pyrinomonadaceae bacterium]|nr:DUF4870 domain-containing protein [Pyrinomonadaceae bacterium]
MQNQPPLQTSNRQVAPSPKSSTGLDENIAALLSYVMTWVTGLIFFLIEKESRLVRFHAMQALILGGVAAVSSFVLWIAYFVVIIIASQIHGALGSLLSILLGLVIFLFFAAIIVGWILGMVKAYQGQYFKLPVIGNFAEKFSAK